MRITSLAIPAAAIPAAIALSFATFGVGLTAAPTQATGKAMQASTPSTASAVAGTWKGPFGGTNFTFEFRQTNTGLAGRYTSDKAGKWAPLHDVSYTGGTLQFSFVSQPPASFAMTMDGGGRTMSGKASFGTFGPIPLSLTRAS